MEADDTVDAVQPPAEFDRRGVLLVSGAHMAHDIYPAFLGVLLPLLIEELGISLAVAGLLASAIRITTSLQPVLGHLADRTDTRYWVIITPATTGLCMSLLGVSPSSVVAAILLLTAGVSHAAFHPAGGAVATRAAGDQWGKGSAWFMTGGEVGRVLGPLLISGIVAVGGLRLSPVAVVPGILASLFLWRRLRRAGVLQVASRPPAHVLSVLREGRRPLMLLSSVVALRAFANVAIVIYYPTFATERGYALFIGALALALYEVGAVVGTLVGGAWSDRHGGVSTMIRGMLVAVPTMLGAVVLGPSWSGLAVLLLAGFFWLSGSPVELALMQRMLPDNRSTAVGVTYFMRAVGAIAATMSIGTVGEAFDLGIAMLGAIAVGSLSILSLLVLRGDHVPAISGSAG